MRRTTTQGRSGPGQPARPVNAHMPSLSRLRRWGEFDHRWFAAACLLGKEGKEGKPWAAR